ncbi:PepSY domain-containing protein [Luteimonas sp. RIT-PG2_3]
MTPWLRKLHKWVGLLIGLQFAIWIGSGLLMGLFDQDTVRGQRHRAPAPAAQAWPADALPPAQLLARSGDEVSELDTLWILDQPVYRLLNGADRWLLDARSGETFAITSELATAIAAADYTGPGHPLAPRWLSQANLEARAHAGAMWAVDFDDGEGTTRYVSAQDGRVLERRNTLWRVFDIAWMLHIMDYTGRKDFNNPLVIMMAAGGLWMALTGVWLLFASFHGSEFIPARWRKRHALTLYDRSGTLLGNFPTAAGDDVFRSLGQHDVQLPSNCGGGQSCGLCAVRVRGKPPAATASDRAQLSDVQLRQGYRLACNLPVTTDMSVEAEGGAQLWQVRKASVVSTRAVSPFLREIVLRPQAGDEVDFRPGAYLQLQIPAYHRASNELQRPEGGSQAWDALPMPTHISSKEPVRRSYSLSLPTTQADGCLTLLVRFIPGTDGKRPMPPGRGSSHVYMLRAGDEIAYSGPFGDFALAADASEHVFIGGGAGMGPLRAMIHAQLASGDRTPVRYWYGARSLEDTPYLDELQALARQHAHFSWTLVLSEQAHSAHLHGWVHDAFKAAMLDRPGERSGTRFYVCGPPAMLAATRRSLREAGIPDTQVAFDDFKI